MNEISRSFNYLNLNEKFLLFLHLNKIIAAKPKLS